MEWLKGISKGWIVGASLIAGPAHAEPRDMLYTALLEMAASDGLPQLNAPAEEAGPPVAPDLERPEEPLQRSPGRKANPALLPSRLNPTNDVLPLELVPSAAVPAAVNGQREAIQERYPNGGLKIERHVVQDAAGNFVHDGTWRWFNPKGQIVAEGEYAQGQRDGTWRRMYRKEDSPLFATSPYRDFESPFLSEATFQDGKLQGPWMISDAQNRKISEINFEAGVRQGPATWWHAQGSPMIQSTFEKGELQGEVFTFTAAGKTVSREIFEAGQKLDKATEKFSDGKVRQVANVLSGHWKLVGNDDWWSASLSKFQVVGQSVKHGKVTTYHRNGLVQSEQEFDRGRPVGQITWWHENGQKALVGSYSQEGIALGRWTWWHKNGLKSIEGEYVAGAPAGNWLTWDQQGKVSSRGKMDDASNEVIATKPQLPAAPNSNSSDYPTRLGQPRDVAE